MTIHTTRRTILRLFAAACLAPALPAAARPMRPVADLCIAGGGYHGLDRARGTMAVGDVLRLRREPGNRHDPNAVEVLDASGLKLGYLPRRLAARAASDLDAGRVVEARVLRFRGDGAGTGAGVGAADRPGRLWRTDCRDGDPVVRLLSDDGAAWDDGDETPRPL